MFNLLGTAKVTTGVGPEILPSFLLGHVAVALTSAFTFLINTSFSLSITPDYWRQFTIDDITKSSNSNVLVKHFLHIGLASSGGKLTKHVVLRHPRSSVNSPEDHFQLTYKSSKSTLDAVAFIYITFTNA